MSFSVSNLANWNDTEGQLTIKAVAKNRLAGIPNLHYVPLQGSSSVEVPYVFSSPVFRTAACGWTSTGTTTLGTRTVTGCFIQMQEGMCDIDLRTKALSKFMNATNDGLPFEEVIASEKAQQISKFVEQLAFQGNTASGSNGNQLCDGLLRKLDYSYSATTQKVTATAITSSNALAMVDAVVAALPSEVKGSDYVAVLVNQGDFDKFMVNLRNLNLYHYASETNGDYVVKVPGYSNVWLHGFAGLTAGRIVATHPENIIFAFDVPADGSLEMYFDKSNREYRAFAEFRVGFDIHFESLVAIM